MPDVAKSCETTAGKRFDETPSVTCDSSLWQGSSLGALGRTRTSDTRFRKPVLYPLSYEGMNL